MTMQTNLDNTRQEIFDHPFSPELHTAKPAWYRNTAKYARPNLRKSIWQAINTLVPYALLWVLMIFTVKAGYSYWITLALAVVAAGILVRVFILFHDCCHGSFFASRRANAVLGYVAGILTFTAFEDWRRVHNRHHVTAGDLDRRGAGDIWTLTMEEYLAAPLRQRLAYRFYRNPFILLGPGALLLFLVIQRFASKGAGVREGRSVLYTNLAILLIVGMSAVTIGLPTYLLIQLPIIMIAGSLGLWLFYVQHQFETAYWVRHDSWDPMRVALAGSSYLRLPKILQWFTGNIGLHHVHHVRPAIPSYNLQQCHDEVSVFQTVKAITLKTSFRSLKLGLYDAEKRQLVSFRSLSTVETLR